MISATITALLGNAVFRTPHTGRYLFMGYAVLALVLGGYSIYLLIETLKERRG